MLRSVAILCFCLVFSRLTETTAVLSFAGRPLDIDKNYQEVLRETFESGTGLFINTNITSNHGFWTFEYELEDERGMIFGRPTGSTEGSPRMCTSLNLSGSIFVSALAYFKDTTGQLSLVAQLVNPNTPEVIDETSTFDYLPPNRWLTTTAPLEIPSEGEWKLCIQAFGVSDLSSIYLTEVIAYTAGIEA